MVIIIDLPYACFWLETNSKDRIQKAPPIARWTLGKHMSYVLNYYTKKSAKIMLYEIV